MFSFDSETLQPLRSCRGYKKNQFACFVVIAGVQQFQSVAFQRSKWRIEILLFECFMAALWSSEGAVSSAHTDCSRWAFSSSSRIILIYCAGESRRALRLPGWMKLKGQKRPFRTDVKDNNAITIECFSEMTQPRIVLYVSCVTFYLLLKR